MATNTFKPLSYLFLAIGLFLLLFGTSARYCDQGGTNCSPVIYFVYFQPLLISVPGVFIDDYTINLVGGLIFLTGLALMLRVRSVGHKALA
ncbi:hypothetical protein AUF78_16675 [archaeon 13_1_20CM_2_51_12]|nr:MAG: hypothetical protein AUF78_16675 [archaeon 13_1_20CM_2_51_12]